MNKIVNSESRFSFFNALSIIGILISLSLLIFQFFKSDKLAYVNTGIVLEKYQGMIDAKKKYEILSQQWRDNVDTLANEFQNELKNYEKGQGSMSVREKRLSQELLSNKQQQMRQYQQAIQQRAREEESNLTDVELKKINSYMERYGAKHHFKIIFGTIGGNILYADKGNDITNDIIEGLNKEYKVK